MPSIWDYASESMKKSWVPISKRQEIEKADLRQKKADERDDARFAREGERFEFDKEAAARTKSDYEKKKKDQERQVNIVRAFSGKISDNSPEHAKRVLNMDLPEGERIVTISPPTSVTDYGPAAKPVSTITYENGKTVVKPVDEIWNQTYEALQPEDWTYLKQNAETIGIDNLLKRRQMHAYLKANPDKVIGTDANGDPIAPPEIEQEFMKEPQTIEEKAALAEKAAQIKANLDNMVLDRTFQKTELSKGEGKDIRTVTANSPAELKRYMDEGFKPGTIKERYSARQVVDPTKLKPADRAKYMSTARTQAKLDVFEIDGFDELSPVEQKRMIDEMALENYRALTGEEWDGAGGETPSVDQADPLGLLGILRKKK